MHTKPPRSRHHMQTPLGVGHQPAGDMAGHVNLRYNTDPQSAGTLDDGGNVFVTVARFTGQLRKSFALQAKRLVVGQMQM